MTQNGEKDPKIDPPGPISETVTQSGEIGPKFGPKIGQLGNLSRVTQNGTK